MSELCIPSYSIQSHLTIEIKALYGEVRKFVASLTAPCSGITETELSLTIEVLSRGVRLVPPMPLGFPQSGTAFECTWGIGVELPLKILEIPVDAVIIVRVWSVTGDASLDEEEVEVGACQLSVFKEDTLELQTGPERLLLRPINEAFGMADRNRDRPTMAGAPKRNDCDGELISWLNSLAYREGNRLNSLSCSDELFLLVSILPPPIAEKYPICYIEEPVCVCRGSGQPSCASINGATTNMSDRMPLLKVFDPGPLRLPIFQRTEEERTLRHFMSEVQPDSLDQSTKSEIWALRKQARRFGYLGTLNLLRCSPWADEYACRKTYTRLLKDARMETIMMFLLPSFTVFKCSFTLPRAIAISYLSQMSDAELAPYQLFLVHACIWDNAEPPTLRDFLLQRAESNPDAYKSLQWYLKVAVEGDNSPSMRPPRPSVMLREMYDSLRQSFTKGTCNSFANDEKLVETIEALSKEIKALDLTRPQKIAKLKSMLAGEWGERLTPCCGPELLVFSTREFMYSGVVPEKAHVFKSSINPMMIPFRGTCEGKEAISSIIFKLGDDVRQDELVMSLLMLTENILKFNGLDLCLSPYKVIAFGSNSGSIECVYPSMTLQDVLAEHKTIRAYFASQVQVVAPGVSPLKSPELFEEDGVLKSQITKFVRSCSGYSVFTYLVGIGDRHLENILLCPDGRMFHIDFGFIFGRDPKPLPPAIKINKEMVDAMDGQRGRYYCEFLDLSCEVYNLLRRHVALFYTLFTIMSKAGIVSVVEDAESDFREFVSKFKMKLSDEEAGDYLRDTIQQCVSALFPVAMDYVHKFVQGIRT